MKQGKEQLVLLIAVEETQAATFLFLASAEVGALAVADSLHESFAGRACLGEAGGLAALLPAGNVSSQCCTNAPDKRADNAKISVLMCLFSST